MVLKHVRFRADHFRVRGWCEWTGQSKQPERRRGVSTVHTRMLERAVNVRMPSTMSVCVRDMRAKARWITGLGALLETVCEIKVQAM